MKVFITGLCFQGNKGGPAIALSLMDNLKKELGDCDFVFSVPGESYGELFSAEEKWAKYYGVEVVENFSHYELFSYFISGAKGRRKPASRWIDTLKSADLVLDMTAISYTGPPLGKTRRIIFHGRFRYFCLARFYRKPFLAWTQSYGPFSNLLIRYMARRDLGSLPVIFCRGERCQELVAEILPAAKTRSFPDVAITLGRDERIDAEVLSFFEGPEKVITISPSAVIYSRSHAQNGENKHVELLVSTITRLIQQGKKVLLVPHTYSVVSHAPDICDYGVCLKILKNLPVKTPGLKLLEGDLSPKVLKSVVARAYIHIGGRYHSLVASLSTGVPSIALSWHHKYKDLLKQYGVANSIVDDREPDQAEHLLRLFDDLLTNHADIQALLQNKQRELGSYIDDNVKLLVDSYNEIS